MASKLRAVWEFVDALDVQFPRVDDIETSSLEGSNLARGNGEAACLGNGGDVAVWWECGSLLPPWSRYKGASKLAHSKDLAVVRTNAVFHFQLHPRRGRQLP
jgi:hypothetical protein